MKNIFFLLVFCFGCPTIFAQPTYYMNNLTVDDCEGILFDSEAGDIGGTYDHNENFVFSICIPGNGDIIMDFISFCTEEDFDFLSLYDGPNITSPQIGAAYHGEIDPPQIVATSGCLTLHFTSDPNVVCTGWEAHWYVEIQDPIPVDILDIPNLPCESNSMNITFAEPVPCDSINLGAFQLFGPQAPAIASVSPAPCTGNTTTNVNINFASPISTSGNYTIIWTTYEFNECGKLDTLRSIESFSVVDCPVSVFIEGGDNACAGACISLAANASGGLSGAYTYIWSSGSNNRTIEVCPEGPTTYSVTVSDANGSTTIDEININPLPRPTIDQDNISICQSDDPFTLSAMPPGGNWQGMGFDEDNALTGLYQPSLTTGLSDTVIYEGPNGCTDQIVIEIALLDVGTDDAACPGSDPFIVSGGLPVGGIWSGNGISSDGLFTPGNEGSFEMTYTHPNGCSGSKMVHVGPIVLTPLDSICQSEESFQLLVSPPGGTWIGEGIDEETNWFDPGEADHGEILLRYEINGCADSMVVFIKEINESGNITACPDQAPFILPGNWTPNGVWGGAGIIDPVVGLYDPSILGDDQIDTLTFSINGCTANRFVRIHYTDINQSDTLEICSLDDPLNLNDGDLDLDLIPGDGNWSGAGILNLGDNDWAFDPFLAGEGVHKLFYEKNTCVDSMIIKVSSTPNIISIPAICEAEMPITLQAFPANGIWEGNGITNEQEGLFDPQMAGEGIHEVFVTTPDGCRSGTTINVFPDEDAVIAGLDDFYCFVDSILLFTTTPANGILTVDEAVFTSLNPREIGSGVHMIRYAEGAGECYSETTFELEIGPELLVELPTTIDSICYGNSLNISATGIGGDSTAGYTYHWNQGLGFGRNQYITPTSTTSYSVSINDGCSETAVGNLQVFVHPNFNTFYDVGPTVCFDDTTFAVLHTTPTGNYRYQWDSDPPFVGETYFSYPTSYNVEVLNETTGCYKDVPVQLPGYDLIKANFMLSPNVDCIGTTDPKIEVIDLSVGAKNGYWDFGDESPRLPYEFGEDINHIYADTGHYVITLHLENEGNCMSEDFISICVNAEHRLFAPNAFTPNYDGKNDVFAFKGFDISQISWQIFNRWGELIFEGKGMNDSWDGFYKGNRVSPGVFTYMANYQTKYGEQGSVKGFVTVVY